jgi:hypothetical protein
MAGGYRPGSGAKKGQHRVHVKELKDAIETMIGQPFQDIQATVFRKLFTDFQGDKNIKEFLIFNENMGRRILLEQEIVVNNTSELSDEELKARAAIILATAKSIQPQIEDDQQNN